MGVPVDESWGNHLALGINNLGRTVANAAHFDDLAVLNADVCPVSWSTRPVYDDSVFNCQVEPHEFSPLVSGELIRLIAAL
jgi:hypothetical protein